MQSYLAKVRYLGGTWSTSQTPLSARAKEYPSECMSPASHLLYRLCQTETHPAHAGDACTRTATSD
jgi:hypothetical protein